MQEEFVRVQNPAGTNWNRGLNINRPALEWDAAHSSVVIEASSGGGMLYDPNPMRLARLRGDGQLIWVEEAGANGGRRVKVATLTTDQVRHLLQTIVDGGFFGWKDSYSPGVVYDAHSTCLRVSLASVTKSVCQTLSGAPPRFEDLLGVVGTGPARPASTLCPTVVT